MGDLDERLEKAKENYFSVHQLFSEVIRSSNMNEQEVLDTFTAAWIVCIITSIDKTGDYVINNKYLLKQQLEETLKQNTKRHIGNLDEIIKLTRNEHNNLMH